MRTDRPLDFSRAASLPIIVVLPTPFTPTTSTTHGRVEGGGSSGNAPPPCSTFSSSSASALRHSPASFMPRRFEQLVGDLRAEVGLEQGLFEALLGVLVELLPDHLFERLLDAAGDLLLRLLEALREAIPETHGAQGGRFEATGLDSSSCEISRD